MSEPVIATVVIVTHNRKEDLRRAVVSALAQVGGVEVLVLDDASTDGTEEMMRTEYPDARYDRVEKGVGYIVHRNRAADLARGPVLVSIDDDAEFSTPNVVQQTVEDFDDLTIGAVAIPYIDVLKSDKLLQSAPDAEAAWATGLFRGTAYAVRKSVFAEVGRFRESFFHQGEEYEFCLRMHAAGHAVRLGRAEPIHHHESPKRVRAFIVEQALRNWVITIGLNYPLLAVPYHLARTAGMGLRTGLRRKMMVPPIRGYVRGLGYVLSNLGQRRAVSGGAFRQFRKLWLNHGQPEKAVPVSSLRLPA